MFNNKLYHVQCIFGITTWLTFYFPAIIERRIPGNRFGSVDVQKSKQIIFICKNPISWFLFSCIWERNKKNRKHIENDNKQIGINDFFSSEFIPNIWNSKKWKIPIHRTVNAFYKNGKRAKKHRMKKQKLLFIHHLIERCTANGYFLIHTKYCNESCTNHRAREWGDRIERERKFKCVPFYLNNNEQKNPSASEFTGMKTKMKREQANQRTSSWRKPKKKHFFILLFRRCIENGLN